MERAIAFEVRRPGDLLAINHCRLYCGVITLADACTADGRRIARPVYECSVRNFRNSKLFWPCLPPPTEKQKNIWRKAIVDGQASFHVGDVLQEEEKVSRVLPKHLISFLYFT